MRLKGEQGKDGRDGATGAEGRPGRDARHSKPTTREKLLPVGVVLLALAMGGQYVYLLSGVRERAQCQADERSRLGGLSDDNQNNLILGVAKLSTAQPVKPTRAQKAALTVEYRRLFVVFTTEAARVAEGRRALLDGKVCD